MAASRTARKNKTKQKQKLLQTSLPERVKGKRLGEMAKSLLSLPTVDFEYNNVIRLCHLHLALHFKSLDRDGFSSARFNCHQ